MEEYWKEAIDYDTYLQDAHQRIDQPKNDDEVDKKDYYTLGLQRMNRMDKIYKASPEDLNILESKNFDGKILIISEPWCGDASQSVPVINKFFDGKNEVRIYHRDHNPELINQFLTDGSQSIPKVLILDKDFNVINTWGPRPAYGTQLLKKYKESPETYPKEEFYNDLHVYYTKNRGKDTIKEILELL